MIITLKASDLFCKMGFNDGDLLDDLFYDHPELGHASAMRGKWLRIYFDNLILCALVELYLLPLCPGLEISYTRHSHNPIRCDDDPILETKYENVEISLEEATVIAVGNAILKTVEYTWSLLDAEKPLVVPLPSTLVHTAAMLKNDMELDIQFVDDHTLGINHGLSLSH